MKNLTKIFMAVAALVAVSCTTDVTEDLRADLGGKTTLTFSLEESRTQLGVKAGSLYPVTWCADDAISVNGVTSNSIVIADGGNVATFEFNGTLNRPYCVAYPATTEGNVLFADQQAYTAGTFANGAATMYGYAEAEGGITLKHLTGVLKVGITGNGETLSYAQVSTADRAAIAGNFALDFANGEVSATSASKELIGYSFGEGVTLSSEPTYMHIAVPAGEYNELYITLYSKDGGVMYATVKAGDSKPLAVGKVREFSNNIIYTPNASVYVIRDKESLKGFAAAVNEAGSAYTKDALMVADVDMTGEDWTSINWKSASQGTDGVAQIATFHGNGYAIKGLNAPLFDTLTANVKGLHLRDVKINETVRPNVGSLARWLRATKVGEGLAKPVISHCSTTGEITINCPDFTYVSTRELAAYAPFAAGGLVATCLSADIEDCVNEIDMDVKQIVSASNTTTLYPWIGGIVGEIESIDRAVYTAEYCSNFRRLTNKGDLKFHDPYTGEYTASKYSPIRVSLGGVIGSLATKAYTCELHDLKNYGKISLSGTLGHDCFIAGVVGRPATASGKNFYNYGDINFIAEGESRGVRQAYIGGVIAISHAVENNNYDNLHNYGKINLKNIQFLSLCVGGVNGCTLSNSSYTETNNMSNLTNSAPITVEDCAQFSGHSNNAYFRVGGVSAWIQHTLNDCVNNKEGVITVKNTTVYNKESALNGFCIGGVVGYKTVFVANNCTNEAEINVDLTTTGDNTMTNAGYNCVNIGGVLGWKSDKTGDNLVNNGNINVSGSYFGRLRVGGIIGTSYATTSLAWTNLTNNGKVTIKDGTTANHGVNVGGIMGNTQNGVNVATNNGDIYIGKDFTVCFESHFAGIAGYVAKTRSNFDNVVNKGNLTMPNLTYTAAVYIGGIIGYGTEDSASTSYPGVFNADQYGKMDLTTNRPARTVWKDELTSGSTLAIGGIGAFIGGLLDNATVHEGADCTLNSKSVTTFRAKNATSDDKGNIDWGDIAWGMKDYPTNCVSYGNFTITGTTNGTFYSGMFGSPYNYSRVNCSTYGTQTINATIKTNCFPSHGCYDGNANATFVNCHNHGDLVFGPKCNVTNQLRAGMFYAKLETASKINILDGCSNSGNIIVEKGAKVGTETRLGTAVGCQNRGVFLIRNGYKNSGNIVFSGACNRKDADKPMCLGGVIGNSSYNGDGDTNTAAYALAATTTVGAISYPAGSWTGDIVNTGSITYDGTCVTGVCIGGIFGDIVSKHTTDPIPSGVKYIFTGNITASGTYATSLVETEGGDPQDCWNGIGGLYGFTTLTKCVVENAEVYSTIAASTFPNVGILYGFERTETIYGKNCKVGGAISEWNEEDEEYISKSINASNYFEHLYSKTITKEVAEGDGCSVLEAKPTVK